MEAEWCWFCSSPLCGECWEDAGECGHEGVEEADRRIRALLRKVVPIDKEINYCPHCGARLDGGPRDPLRPIILEKLNLGARAYNALLNCLDEDGHNQVPDRDILKHPWVPAIRDFGTVSFRETIEALIEYGISRETIEASSFWQTAPGAWKRKCFVAAGTSENPK